MSGINWKVRHKEACEEVEGLERKLRESEKATQDSLYSLRREQEARNEADRAAKEARAYKNEVEWLRGLVRDLTIKREG